MAFFNLFGNKNSKKQNSNEKEYSKSLYIPSANGLSPVEILLLEYVSYGKYPSEDYPRFWKTKYNISDVTKRLKELENKGFINLKENAKYCLTDIGVKELQENKYAVYWHKKPVPGLDLITLNKLVYQRKNLSFRDVIWGELNRQIFEYAGKNEKGLLRNIYYYMAGFVYEEKKFIDSFHLRSIALFYDLNSYEPFIAPGLVKELKKAFVSANITEEAAFALLQEKLSLSGECSHFDPIDVAGMAVNLSSGDGAVAYKLLKAKIDEIEKNSK